eukprot:14635015-Ditylum_brightwellii.AAC.1
MLYEEDIEGQKDEVNEGIDNPLPYDPNSIVGNIEEDTNMFDEYLGAELILDPGPDRSLRKRTVSKRHKGDDGRPIGTSHYNPLLDTRRYDV